MTHRDVNYLRLIRLARQHGAARPQTAKLALLQTAINNTPGAGDEDTSAGSSKTTARAIFVPIRSLDMGAEGEVRIPGDAPADSAFDAMLNPEIVAADAQ